MPIIIRDQQNVGCVMSYKKCKLVESGERGSREKVGSSTFNNIALLHRRGMGREGRMVKQHGSVSALLLL